MVDLARHFTQYWNHAVMQKYGKTDKKLTLMHAKDILIEEYIPEKINLSHSDSLVVL